VRCNDMIDRHLYALNSQDLVQVEHAIIALGESNSSKAVAPLVRALHRFHQLPEVKALLCDALGELGDLRATQALLSHLRDPDAEVRESAFTALFAIGERRAHAMPDASSWDQGFSDPTTALTQIAWQTDHEAVSLLVKALQGDDQQVKVGALYTLGQLGFIGAFEQIKAALFDHADDVNAAAAFALGELARQGSTEISIAVCEALYQVWYREQSGGLPLGLEAQIQVLRATAECVTSSPHPIVQQQVAALLIAALDHTEHILRQLAVIGLGRLGDPRALPVLGQRLMDTESGVRRNAAYAIGALRASQGAHIIVESAAGQPSEVRVAMSWSLKRIPRRDVLNALDLGSSSASPKQRAVSAYLLGELSEGDRLAQMISDPNPEVRKSVVLAMGNTHVYTLYSLLIPTLEDDDWRVRTAAAEALKRLKSVQAISALNHRIELEDHSVVRNAINSALKSLTSL
jgi:HEAT repeat protein